MLLAYGAVIPGVALATWGARASDKWLKQPRDDQLLGRALKGLTRGYRLYSYELPAEHVICCPSGLHVVKLKGQDGSIFCTGSRWRRSLTVRRALGVLSESPMGNPTKQALAEVAKMQRLLSAHLPGVVVPIKPVIAFTSPEVHLELRGPSVPTMLLPDLKGYLRDTRLGPDLSTTAAESVLALLDEQAS